MTVFSIFRSVFIGVLSSSFCMNTALASPSRAVGPRAVCRNLTVKTSSKRALPQSFLKKWREGTDRLLSVRNFQAGLSLKPEELGGARHYLNQLVMNPTVENKDYREALGLLVSEMQGFLTVAQEASKGGVQQGDIELLDRFSEWGREFGGILGQLPSEVGRTQNPRLDAEVRRELMNRVMVSFLLSQTLTDFYSFASSLVDNEFVGTSGLFLPNDSALANEEKLLELIEELETLRSYLEHLTLEESIQIIEEEEAAERRREALRSSSVEKPPFLGTLNDWYGQGASRQIEQLVEGHPYKLLLDPANAFRTKTIFDVVMTKEFLQEARNNPNQSLALFNKLFTGQDTNGEGWSVLRDQYRYFDRGQPFDIIKIKKKGHTHYRFLGCLDRTTNILYLKFFGLTPESVDSTQNEVYRKICPP